MIEQAISEIRVLQDVFSHLGVDNIKPLLKQGDSVEKGFIFHQNYGQDRIQQRSISLEVTQDEATISVHHQERNKSPLKLPTRRQHAIDTLTINTAHGTFSKPINNLEREYLKLVLHGIKFFALDGKIPKDSTLAKLEIMLQQYIQ